MQQMSNSQNDYLGFWFKLIASLVVATVMSVVIGVVNLMICAILLDIYRHQFNFMGEAYWILTYSGVVFVISWIISFGYLMSEE